MRRTQPKSTSGRCRRPSPIALIFLMHVLSMGIGGCTQLSGNVSSAPIVLIEDDELRRYWYVEILRQSPLDLYGPSIAARLVRERPKDLYSKRELSRVLEDTPPLHNPGVLNAIARNVTHQRLHRHDYVIIGIDPLLIALRGHPRPDASAGPKQPLRFDFITEADLNAQVSRLYIVEALSDRDVARIAKDDKVPPNWQPDASLREVPLHGMTCLVQVLNGRPWRDQPARDVSSMR